MVEGIRPQTGRRKPASVRIGPSSPSTTLGVAQLGARVIWDHEAAGSRPATETISGVRLGVAVAQRQSGGMWLRRCRFNSGRSPPSACTTQQLFPSWRNWTTHWSQKPGPRGISVPPGRPLVLAPPHGGSERRERGGDSPSSTRTEGTILIAQDRAQARSRARRFRRETRRLTGQGSQALPVCGDRACPVVTVHAAKRETMNPVKRWTPARVGVRFPASPPLDSSVGRATHSSCASRGFDSRSNDWTANPAVPVARPSAGREPCLNTAI